MANNSKAEYIFDPDILNELKLGDWEKTTCPTSIKLTCPAEDLILRPLKRDDNKRGFPEILEQLSVVGDVNVKMFQETFDMMKATPNTYYVIVIEDVSKGKVIGSGTLLIEQKFSHNCAKRGFIEDVVVSTEYRGKQLGKLLITSIVLLSQFLKCYKVSLDCRDHVVQFYEALGFVKEPGYDNFMSIRF